MGGERGGARRAAGRGQGGIREAAAWGERYATNKTYGCGRMRATHEKRPIAEERIDVLHVALGKYKSPGHDACHRRVESQD